VATPLGSDLSLWTASPPADSDLHQALGGQTVKAAFWSVAGLMALALLWLTWGRSAADQPAIAESRPASGDRAVPAPSSIPRDRAPAVPATALGAIGRYLLLERIGEGGMAEIFAAASLGAGGFRRFFVIKRLRPEWTSHPEATSHFIDEASLMSTLVHPNIVPVFDFGEADGAYYLAQEYVAGRDLGRLCRRMAEGGQAPLSPQAVLCIVDLVLGALEYAHGRRDDDGAPLQIVHRDVTPANVMISETGEVKLIDFGIVKSARPRLSQTQLGQINGNLEYMAPEQARGQDVDARTDLFSLGLVAYTAATGERLYRGDTLLDLLNRAAAGPGADERERIARLPHPLPALLERALAIDPADRFQNAGEFRAALAPHRSSGKAELIQALTRNFADELRQEQERLVRACPRTVQLSATKARVA
jgi:serine/threonine-protein kinase